MPEENKINKKNRHLCHEAAQKTGVPSVERANSCQKGEWCCPECPIKETAKNWRQLSKSIIQCTLKPVVWSQAQPK